MVISKSLMVSLILLFLVISLAAQTKEETEAWIKQKLEANSYQSGEIVYHYTLSFEGCVLIVKDKCDQLTSNKSDIMTSTIPIEQISSISFKEFDDLIQLRIKIKDDLKLIKINYQNLNTNYKSYLDSSEETIILEKTIKEDNLQQRVIQAFNHLIALCGGTVVKEVF